MGLAWDTAKLETQFSFGYCLVFAIVLRNDYGLKIHGASNSYGIIQHYWGVFVNNGVDVYGIRPETVISDAFPGTTIVDCSNATIESEFSKLPPRIAVMQNPELAEQARNFIQNNDRFRELRDFLTLTRHLPVAAS
jgi:hypothetical protein